jgi:hypothetical protein
VRERKPRRGPAARLTIIPLVDAVWRRLLDRSGPRPGLPLTNEPDLHLLVNGRRIDAATPASGIAIFHLPDRSDARPSCAARIVSRAAVPQELGLMRDPRSLGVVLRRIEIHQGNRSQVIEADDPILSGGLHAFEAENGFRWTNGDAGLPHELFGGMAGPIKVIVHYAGTTHYIADGAAGGVVRGANRIS